MGSGAKEPESLPESFWNIPTPGGKETPTLQGQLCASPVQTQLSPLHLGPAWRSPVLCPVASWGTEGRAGSTCLSLQFPDGDFRSKKHPTPECTRFPFVKRERADAHVSLSFGAVLWVARPPPPQSENQLGDCEETPRQGLGRQPSASQSSSLNSL